MSVDISTKHAFPKLSCKELYDFYTNQEILQQRYEIIGARNIIFSKFEGSDELYSIESTREIHADLPKLLKKFASEWNPVTQTDLWRPQNDGSFLGNMTIHIEAELPVEFTGTMHVKPDGEGCSNYIDLQVSCPVRIVGKVAELFIKGKALESMEDEYQAMLEILSNR